MGIIYKTSPCRILTKEGVNFESFQNKDVSGNFTELGDIVQDFINYKFGFNRLLKGLFHSIFHGTVSKGRVPDSITLGHRGKISFTVKLLES